MRRWVLPAIAIVTIVGLGSLYLVVTMESQGASAFAIANYLGFIVVIVGVVAAGAILRRSAVPQGGKDSRNA